MIIHIVGPSGSGKSTLGKKLLKKYKNKVKVFDTDDLEKPHRIKLINKFKFEKKSDWTKYDKETAKLNKKILEKIINKYENKIIIFVGFIHPGMDILTKKSNYTYMIEIDELTLWNQYNLRTAELIHKYFNQIKKILSNKKMSGLKKHLLLMYKYDIRQGFDSPNNRVDELKNVIKNGKMYAKRRKWFYGTVDKIVKDIHKQIKQL